MMIIDFNENSSYSDEDHVLIECFKEAHKKIIDLYLHAIKKEHDTKIVFKLLTFFEERKVMIEKGNVDLVSDCNNNELFSALITDVMLSKLPKTTFLENYGVTVYEYRQKNNENIMEKFNNYLKESNQKFEVEF